MRYSVYHGSNNVFERFADGKAFFTEDLRTAEFFGKIIYRCEINLEHPLMIDANGQSWGGMFLEAEPYWKDLLRYAITNSGGNPDDEDDEETEYWNNSGITLDFIGDWAKENGYDGVIADDVYDDDAGGTNKQYIVFDADNIYIT